MKKEIKTFIPKVTRWTTAAVCVLAVASCTKDFEKINTNPNGVTNEDMLADFNYIGMKFTQPERSIYFAYADGGDGVAGFQVTHNLNADIFSGYMMSPGFEQTNGNYALHEGWNNAPWSNYYPNLMAPTQRIIELAVRDNYPDFIAFAKIIRVIGMQQILDKYGPISYATYGGGGNKSSYESEESVYKTFIKELEAAVVTLTDFDKNKPELTKRFRAFDVLSTKGDYKEWIKLANSLCLRIAIRLSNIPSMKAECKRLAEAAVSNEYGLLDKDITFASSGNKNPLYDCSVVYEDINMGSTMESILTGYNDPRLEVFWQPSKFDNKYRGIPNGALQSTKSRYKDFSKINLEQMTTVNPNPIMFAAEIFFLKAEGALRGWSMGGDAQGFYEAGIARSFAQHGCGSAVSYISDNTSVGAPYTDPTIGGELTGPVVAAGDKRLNNVTIAWNESASNEEKLAKIITQKWIALFPLGQEAWSEYRRTGYPTIMPVWDNNSANPSDNALLGWKDCNPDGSIPAGKMQIRRLCFPLVEYQNNAEAIPGACALLGSNGAPGNPVAGRSGDMPSARLWWDQGQNNF